jgi:phosphotransferase system HPr-like phosphotransfer protein
LMLLGAGAGVVLTLRARGEDAEQAVAVLGELIDRGFDE